MKEIKELWQKNLKELHALLASEREKLRQLRFDLVSGKVKNIRSIRDTKKTIARILTVINAKSKIKND